MTLLTTLPNLHFSTIKSKFHIMYIVQFGLLELFSIIVTIMLIGIDFIYMINYNYILLEYNSKII